MKDEKHKYLEKSTLTLNYFGKILLNPNPFFLTLDALTQNLEPRRKWMITKSFIFKRYEVAHQTFRPKFNCE